MTPFYLEKQTGTYKLPHNWLVRLAIDLAALSDIVTVNHNFILGTSIDSE